MTVRTTIGTLLRGAAAAAALVALAAAPARAAGTWGAVDKAEGAAAGKVDALTVLPFTIDGALVDGDLGRPQKVEERMSAWAQALQLALVKAIGKGVATPAETVAGRTGLVLRGEFVLVDPGVGDASSGLPEVTLFGELFETTDPLKSLYAFTVTASLKPGGPEQVDRMCEGPLPSLVAKAVKGAAKATPSAEAASGLAGLRKRQGRDERDDDEEMKAPNVPRSTADSGEGVMPTE